MPKISVPYINLSAQHSSLKAELLDAIGNVIDSGQFILGEEVQRFEQRFAELCGVHFAVAVNSGTDALILALRALGIGEADEVITAPNSFIASTSCIALVGAKPVFVDVRDDYNIDPNLIEDAITTKTKAILPVHLTGHPADMYPLMEIAKKHDLYIVEDCAQAILAEYGKQRVGSFGEMGCFSLHPLKTLNACGDGGIITTNDEILYEKLKIFRNLGLRTRDDCVTWSINSRLDTMQAALLLVKMKYLHEWTERRRANAKFYQDTLRGIAGFKVPMDKDYEKGVYHTFVVQAERRDELKQYLDDHGVGTSIHYPVPIHLHEAASSLGYGLGNFPVTELQAQKILSLPIYPELSQADLDYVVTLIQTFYQAE